MSEAIVDRIDAANELTQSQVTFHQSEFNSLKSEVAERIKSVAENFQYALVSSAAIFTWLLVHGPGADDHSVNADGAKALLDSAARWGIWLPAVISFLFVLFSAASYSQIGTMGRYMAEIEKKLGHASLGWEKRWRKRQPILGTIYAMAWLILFLGNVVLAYTMAHASS